ncbi:MAG TPA: hypothetical protein PLW50_00085 [Smithellaceae bacterium]|nr:hypothetical protein [Smithellaceae bacterium]
MNEYDLACSVEHHFNKNMAPQSEVDYEEKEKERLLRFPKHERSLWCWICGFMLDPCAYPTPKEGVEVFNQHLAECERGRMALDNCD